MLDLPPLSEKFEDFFDQWKIPDQNVRGHQISLRSLIFILQDQFRLGNHEFVLKILSIMEASCSPTNVVDSECGFIRLWRGTVYRKIGKFDYARIDLSQASDYFIFIEDYENYARCLLCLGDVLRAKAITRVSLMSGLYLLQALSFYLKGKQILETKIPQAEKQDRTYLLLSAQFQWAIARAFIVLRIANHKVLKGLRIAWDLSCQTHSTWAQEECAQLLARYYEIKNNFREALKWYEISYANASSSRNVDRLIETMISLAKISKKNGDVQNMSLYIEEASQILTPLLKQNLPSNHQFFYFASELELIEKK